MVLPAQRQAAGAPSAWSQPPNLPSSDHAVGATLGRWGAKATQRPRRPGTRESRTVAVSEAEAVAESVSESVPAPAILTSRKAGENR